MFSGIKPTGTFSSSGVSSYGVAVPAAEHARLNRQNYDQFLCSPQPAGEEGRIRETVNQISQRIRIRPTRHEISLLQRQIQDGTYQPDTREIATRILLMDSEEE